MPVTDSACSRRFCTAPRPERIEVTASTAASMAARLAVAMFEYALPTGVARFENEMAIVSLSLAPTWKVTDVEPLSRLTPLNTAALPMRVISADSWSTSDWMAPLPAAESEPLRYCTASSRTRCRMLWTSSRLPSAVCTMDTPSWMLRCAWARPQIWLRIFSEMPRPAASSAALLMRRPDESLSIDLEIASDVADR